VAPSERWGENEEGTVCQIGFGMFVPAGAVAIGVATVSPAQARVFSGFGFGPFWGYRYPVPAPDYAPSAGGASPCDPGDGSSPSTRYFCDNPRDAYVPQCNSGWRAVPATSVQQ
jgi:hypothetical protein